MEWELLALRRRQRLLPMGLPGAMVLLLLTTLLVDFCGPRVQQILRGECSLTGERRYVPAVVPDRQVLARVDLTMLHERLLPRWSLGLGWGRESTEEQRAFAAAFAEAGKDPNLGALLLDLREAARTDAARQSQRIEYLAWAWNHYLAELDSPWYLECTVEVGAGRNHLIVQTYRVWRRASARVGGRSYPLLVLERADHLNVDDAALGRAGVRDGAAQVLVDGVREHAIWRVWPLLHELSSQGTRTDGRFARAVSQEVRAALAPRHFAVLARTAPSYRALLMMRESVQMREDCGSRLRMRHPAARGYSPEFQGRLALIAEGDQGSPCPAITLEEVATIEQESALLSAAEGLDAALDALTDHLIRGVAVHEARHVADQDRARAFVRPLRCPTCPDELGTHARAEVSAYLASFAAESTGAGSLHQACRVASGDSANAIALGFLLPRLLPEGCVAGPPADLHRRARQLERQLFGRSHPISIE
jgi:hypothetical protein